MFNMMPIEKLICIPYAGGSKHSFREFSQYAGKHLTIVPVELPGRAGRVAETLSNNLQFLVMDIKRQIENSIGESYALYGHSMGGLLSYLVTHELVRERRPLPKHLFLSGCRGPAIHSKTRLEYKHRLPKAQFIEQLKSLGGIPQEILENAELMDYFLPIIKSDFEAVESFSYTTAKQLDIPMTVMIGTDENISDEDALQWQLETTRKIRLEKFVGDHFFPFKTPESVVQSILRKLKSYNTDLND